MPVRSVQDHPERGHLPGHWLRATAGLRAKIAGRMPARRHREHRIGAVCDELRLTDACGRGAPTSLLAMRGSGTPNSYGRSSRGRSGSRRCSRLAGSRSMRVALFELRGRPPAEQGFLLHRAGHLMCSEPEPCDDIARHSHPHGAGKGPKRRPSPRPLSGPTRGRRALARGRPTNGAPHGPLDARPRLGRRDADAAQEAH